MQSELRHITLDKISAILLSKMGRCHPVCLMCNCWQRNALQVQPHPIALLKDTLLRPSTSSCQPRKAGIQVPNDLAVQCGKHKGLVVKACRDAHLYRHQPWHSMALGTAVGGPDFECALDSLQDCRTAGGARAG